MDVLSEGTKVSVAETLPEAADELAAVELMGTVAGLVDLLPLPIGSVGATPLDALTEESAASVLELLAEEDPIGVLLDATEEVVGVSTGVVASPVEDSQLVVNVTVPVVLTVLAPP